MADITTRDVEHDAWGRLSHLARTERWAIILTGGDSTRLVGRVANLLGLSDRALPDLSRAFLPLRRFLVTYMESAVAEAVYHRLPSADFSRGVGPNPRSWQSSRYGGSSGRILATPERVLARRGTMPAPWTEAHPSRGLATAAAV